MALITEKEVLNNVLDTVESISNYQDNYGVSTWSVTATADNDVATATKTAEEGKSHYITSISGSFSAAAIQLMELKDDTDTIGNYHVHNQRDIVFAKPVKITAGNAVSLTLAASGSGGVIGAVTLVGFTL
ncbi:MAG: hypothetical protein ACTSYR_04150 [Candidatus Odinarchaeia archaeon]